MEKSKAEEYRERLEKWKQEKQRDKEERTKKMETIQKRPAIIKPVIPNKRKSLLQSQIGNRKSVVENKKPFMSMTKTPMTNAKKPISGVKRPMADAKKPMTDAKKSMSEARNPISVAKKPSVVPRRSNSGESMIDKLKKWREEKGKSEKKQMPAVHKPSSTPRTDLSGGKFKTVKSRLFDYKTQRKPDIPGKENRRSTFTNKTQISLPGSIRKSTGTCMSAKNSVAKPVTKGRHSIAPKPAMKRKSTEAANPAAKRRHSEIPNKKPPQSASKPVTGILKRKSCIGAFNLTEEVKKNTESQTKNITPASEKIESSERRLSYTISETTTPVDSPSLLRPTVSDTAVTPGITTRNVRFGTPPNNASMVGHKTHRKTPKAPTSTNKDRRHALDDWLKAKGRTPSKYRHLMCFHGKHGKDNKSHDPHTKASLSVEELSTQMEVLEYEQQLVEAENRLKGMLEECMRLFEDGCPSESILPWLNDIYEKVPCARTSAQFYECKVAMIKDSLDIDAVLQVFEDATINDAKPREQIAKCLTESVKYVTEQKVKEASWRCKTPRRSHVQEENTFESSKVVYAVSNVTPFSEGKKRRRHPSQGSCQVVTPVRRSTRRSLQNLPDSLRDSKASFSHLEDIDNQNLLFQPNVALDTILASIDSDDE